MFTRHMYRSDSHFHQTHTQIRLSLDTCTDLTLTRHVHRSVLTRHLRRSVLTRHMHRSEIPFRTVGFHAILTQSSQTAVYSEGTCDERCSPGSRYLQHNADVAYRSENVSVIGSACVATTWVGECAQDTLRLRKVYICLLFVTVLDVLLAKSNMHFYRFHGTIHHRTRFIWQSESLWVFLLPCDFTLHCGRHEGSDSYKIKHLLSSAL